MSRRDGATRREVLHGLGVLGAGALLAGCRAGGSAGTTRPGSTGSTGSAARSSAGSRSHGGPTSSSTTDAGSSSGGSSTSSAASSSGPASSRGPAPATDLTALGKQLNGSLLLRGRPGYALVSHGYNPRYDGASPVAVAMCQSTDDVAACIRYATNGGHPFSVRSGGHSYTGWSTGQGLVVDLTRMASVKVSRSSGTARIAAGTRLADVYHDLSAAGVGIPAGSCPTVGMGGLALGGGIGVLSRAWGLTCDTVRSAQVVLADGSLVSADAGHNPDLFWALRGGGGGSFGVVTSLELATRPAPAVQTFVLGFPYAAAADVLDAWQRWVPRTDSHLWSACHLSASAASGSRSILVVGTWIGRAGALTGLLDDFVGRTGTTASFRQGASHSYESAMLLEAGCQSYGACHLPPTGSLGREPEAASSSLLFKPLNGSGIDAVLVQIEHGLRVTSAAAVGVLIDSLGGAVANVPASATAFAWRGAIASLQYTATWPQSSASRDPAPMDGYVRGFRSAMTPYCGSAAYVNYQDAAITNYGSAYWGRNYPRLQQVKKAVDPHNAFTFPQAVRA